MGKTRNVRELLEKIELAEMKDYPEDVRDQAQTILLSRHLALLGSLRKAARHRQEKPRP